MTFKLDKYTSELPLSHVPPYRLLGWSCIIWPRWQSYTDTPCHLGAWRWLMEFTWASTSSEADHREESHWAIMTQPTWGWSRRTSQPKGSTWLGPLKESPWGDPPHKPEQLKHPFQTLSPPQFLTSRGEIHPDQCVSAQSRFWGNPAGAARTAGLCPAPTRLLAGPAAWPSSAVAPPPAVVPGAPQCCPGTEPHWNPCCRTRPPTWWGFPAAFGTSCTPTSPAYKGVSLASKWTTCLHVVIIHCSHANTFRIKHQDSTTRKTD